MSWLRSLLLTLLALRLLGGDLAVLQVAAWGGMIATRSAEQGLAAAVASTLDGEHPCALCLALQDARQTDQPQPASPDDRPTKLKLPDLIACDTLAMAVPQSPAERAGAATPWHGRMAGGRGEAPPVPPPQLG